METEPQSTNLVPKLVLEEKFDILHDYEDAVGCRYLQCRKCSTKFEAIMVSKQNMTEVDGELHAVCPKCNQHTIDATKELEIDIALLQKQVQEFFNKHVRDRSDVLLQMHYAPENQFSLPAFRLCSYGLMGPRDYELLTTFKEQEVTNDHHTDQTGPQE